MIRLFYVIGLLAVIALVVFFGWWAFDSIRDQFGLEHAAIFLGLWVVAFIVDYTRRRRNDRRDHR